MARNCTKGLSILAVHGPSRITSNCEEGVHTRRQEKMHVGQSEQPAEQDRDAAVLELSPSIGTKLPLVPCPLCPAPSARGGGSENSPKTGTRRGKGAAVATAATATGRGNGATRPMGRRGKGEAVATAATATGRGNGEADGAAAVTAVTAVTEDRAVKVDPARDAGLCEHDLLTSVMRFCAKGARQRPWSSLASKAPGAQGGVSTAERPHPKEEPRPLMEPQAMLLRLLCRDSGRRWSAPPPTNPAKPGRRPGSFIGLTLGVGLGVALRIGTGWRTCPGSLASYPWKRGGGWQPSRSTCTNAPLSLRFRHDVRDLSRALLASAAFVKTARGGDLKSTNLGASRPSFGLTPASTSMPLCCSAATSSASSNACARLADLRRRSADVGVPALLMRAERPGLRPGLFFGVRAGLFPGLLATALLDDGDGIFPGKCSGVERLMTDRPWWPELGRSAVTSCGTHFLAPTALNQPRGAPVDRGVSLAAGLR